MDISRYLEYTKDVIKDEFRHMSEEDITYLQTIPAIFAYENNLNSGARVGHITEIKRRGSHVRIKWKLSLNIPPISSSQLNNLAWDLDLEGGEMNRTHWALKDENLLLILKNAGVFLESEEFKFKFSRETLLKSCRILKFLGHSGLDEFILQVGVDGLHAGREVGGLQARCNAIAQYIIENPNALTAENERLDRAIVMRSVQIAEKQSSREMSEDDAAIETDFWIALGADGLGSENGTLIPLTAEQPSLQRTLKKPLPWASRLAAKANEVKESTMVFRSPELKKEDSMDKQKVFIVHGRDTLIKTEVALMIQKAGLDYVILHERPNIGRTIINKFSEEAKDVIYAIVVMTPDDVGGIKGEAGKPRARQNVIFELGFFIGALKAERVCALVVGTLKFLLISKEWYLLNMTIEVLGKMISQGNGKRLE